jgi:hypothetical protein
MIQLPFLLNVTVEAQSQRHKFSHKTLFISVENEERKNENQEFNYYTAYGTDNIDFSSSFDRACFSVESYSYASEPENNS